MHVANATAQADRTSRKPAKPVAQPTSEPSLFAVVARIQPEPRTRLQRLAKRSVDVIGSLFGLLLLSPVFLLAAIAVRLTSRGPVFFAQERCGLQGHIFRFYKFRTMVADAEQRKAELEHLNEVDGPAFKVQSDPRITRLGKILRKTSIDELPQLWNVLRGDMSLVGPRPPTPGEVARYTPEQAQRLAVIPGITGLWQVSGRSEIADFDTWVEMDLEYARRWSIWMDFWILAKTVLVVLTTRGAQ